MRISTIYDSAGILIQHSIADAESCSIAHAMLHVLPKNDSFESQLMRLEDGFNALMSSFDGYEFVFGRCFVSDSANQLDAFNNSKLSNLNISFIQQPPLDGSKIAMWVYMKRQNCPSPYTELWTAGLHSEKGGSYDQTCELLEKYEQYLSNHDCVIKDQCVRTWFFVRDVDTQYKGMVDARRENFETEGMTPNTHYLSSTGIGGLPAHVPSLVQMDAVAVKGLKPEMQHYLYAKSHLNSTYEYGVTFERGTAVEYHDHIDIYISGTASIDNKGNVLFVGDIVRQTERMLENVNELLKEGGASFDDLMQVIVYLRDMADYQTVNQIFAQRMPTNIPLVITYAPVCRPTWLIEMECIAFIPKGTKTSIED